MTALPLVFAGVLGAVLGSFLNALSFRFNTGRSMRGRSRCMHCGHTLRVADLVPIFSYVVLRGRCRYCGAAVSSQYPLVELAGAALGMLTLAAHQAPVEFLFWLLVWMILLFIVVYDVRHTIIPWSCSIPLAALAFVYASSCHISLACSLEAAWANLLAGPLLALPLFLLSAVSGGRWMGWADSLLELSLGWLLGISAGLLALLLAFWVGAVVGVVLLLLSSIRSALPQTPGRRGYTMKSEIPFAPFLILGAAVAHFLHADFFQMLSILS